MFDDNKNEENPFAKEEEKVQEEQENIEEEEKEAANESAEEKLQSELDDINNKYIRLLADFDNYRKRQMSERESLIKYGAEDTLKKIIPVLDTLERAKSSIEKTTDIETVKNSYEVCTKQFKDVLEKIGLKKIEAQGLPFDPNFMEAVMQTPTNEYPAHTVIAELQAGYKLIDRVLRPVMVNVATEASEDKEE